MANAKEGVLEKVFTGNPGMNNALFSAAAMICNEAGGKAYALSAKQALAQMVSTGTLNQTFYVSDRGQLNEILALAGQVDSDYLAKLAIYGRTHCRMKDVPVVLLALLAARKDGAAAFQAAFAQVVDNGKQLRHFVQIMRSGITGRKSLGAMAKKRVNRWLNEASEWQYLTAALGSKPSLRDVLRMTHPKPATPRQEALFRWTLEKEYDENALPEGVRQLIAFQRDNRNPLPEVPFQWLMALDLTTEHWCRIVEQGGWQMLRMNLNTLARHEVFKQPGMAEMVAAKLSDPQAIARSKAFPYQLYTTWSALGAKIPRGIKAALRSAMQQALVNVPKITGNVVVAVDVSGSMQMSVTGYRQGATSVVRCVDAAALFAAAVQAANPTARIMPFDMRVHTLTGYEEHGEEEAWEGNTLRARIFHRQKRFAKKSGEGAVDVLTLAQTLAKFGGGGTNTSLPLKQLNREGAAVDVMIYFSDNESWADGQYGRGTEMMQQWEKLKQRCPQAKLICVDIQPYAHSQVQEREDVLNIGGFGDEVFRLMDLFCSNNWHPDHWVSEIDAVSLEMAAGEVKD